MGLPRNNNTIYFIVAIISLVVKTNAFSVTSSRGMNSFSTLSKPSSLPFMHVMPSSSSSTMVASSSSSSNSEASSTAGEASESDSEENKDSVEVNGTNITSSETEDSKDEIDDNKDAVTSEEAKVTEVEEEEKEVEAKGEEEEKQEAKAEEQEQEDDEKVDDTVVLNKLLQIAASTGRGEFATFEQKEEAADLVYTLEESYKGSSSDNDNSIMGTWELLYSSTQLFRSSPFFMAGRAVCKTTEEARQYDWFCDMHRAALAISNIGTVRQIISETKMTSEFEVKVGAIPFVTPVLQYSGGWPVTIEGAIVSTADIVTNVGNNLEMLMDTVEIKGSNIPGVRQLFDNGVLNKLNSRDLGNFLEDNVDSYTNPTPFFQTTYLNNNIRINRDQDGKLFLYRKTSDSTDVTDYSQVDADLGIQKLLDGFSSTFF